LHQVVRENLATFYAAIEEGWQTELPEFVRAEFVTIGQVGQCRPATETAPDPLHWCPCGRRSLAATDHSARTGRPVRTRATCVYQTEKASAVWQEVSLH
jgi:hypothetical protein